MRTVKAICVSLLLSLFLPVAVFAEDETLEEVVVTGIRVAAGNETHDQLIERLERVPGGTNVIVPEANTQLFTLSDLFANAPGVVVQEFFGGFDQPRLNIRGSGLQSNPVSRGVLLLQDYLPLNDADGSFIIGLLEPFSTRALTVQRGANSRYPGAVTLGGDVNMISFTGAEPGGNLRLDAGDDQRRGGHLNYGDTIGTLDFHLSLGAASYDGFRHHSESERKNLSTNIGFSPNEIVSTRTYLSYTHNNFDMPFVLTSEQAENDPESVMGDGNSPFDQLFNIYDRYPYREYKTWRVANRTRLVGEHHDQTLGLYWQRTDDEFVDPLAHAVSNINTSGAQWMLNLDRGDGGHYQLGLDGSWSSMPREYYVNNASDGSRSYQFGDVNLKAKNMIVSLVGDYPLDSYWTVNSQLQWVHSSRDSRSSGGSGKLHQRWDFLLPKLGINYQPNLDVRVFANLSASRETPTFWEIVQPQVPPLVPLPGMATLSLNELDDQRALTLEVGGAGEFSEAVGWDLSVYRSELKCEILSVASNFGVISRSSNYRDNTVHQGVELAVYGKLPVLDDYISYRAVWNFNDFYFADGVFDGNQIAGAPRNLVSGQVNYHRKRLVFGISILSQPDNNYVDHANTLKQDSFWLFGLNMSYQLSSRVRLYANINNVADQTYTAAYVVRDQSSELMPTYLPGNGRNMNAGVVFSW